MLRTLEYTGPAGRINSLPYILTSLAKNEVAWRISDRYRFWAEFTA